MKFHEKVQELHSMINSWYLDVRHELNMSELPPSLLTHLMAPSSVVKVRDNQKVRNGFYTSMDGSVQVNVLSQDLSTGLIVLEMTGDVSENTDERFQTMSPGVFFTLFKPNDSGTYQKEEMLTLINESKAQPEATRRHLQKEREESFSWNAVITSHGKMAERYSELYDSILKENKETVKSDYLEFLFLTFILGAHLGFSPRHHFHALYSSLFALTDSTLEQCKLTQKYYDEQLVETTYEEFRLYDPILEFAPVVSYFVVMSTKDQTGLDKVFYPKGCFMPSHSVVSNLLQRA